MAPSPTLIGTEPEHMKCVTLTWQFEYTSFQKDFQVWKSVPFIFSYVTAFTPERRGQRSVYLQNVL